MHCGQLLDEIGHDTGMSNDSGVADGTIGSWVALDEFEVDHNWRKSVIRTVRYSAAG